MHKHIELKNSTMEAETIQKNGASLKSYMIKGNRILTLLLFCFALQSCVTFKPEMLRVEKKSSSSRINNLNIITPSTQIGNNRTIKSQSYAYTLFQRELETNILNKRQNNSYGSIEMITIVDQMKLGKPGLLYISCFTGFMLNLFGMPLYSNDVECEFEICIYDRRNKLVKKYNYYGEASKMTGFYYGTSHDVLYIEIVKDILERFRRDVLKDAKRLNERLAKS